MERFVVAGLHVLIPLHSIQRGLGEASIRTTSIDMSAIVPEEIAFAARDAATCANSKIADDLFAGTPHGGCA